MCATYPCHPPLLILSPECYLVASKKNHGVPHYAVFCSLGLAASYYSSGLNSFSNIIIIIIIIIWEENIKMDLQEVGEGCGDWMELAQDGDRWRALVSTVRNVRVPKMRGIS